MRGVRDETPSTLFIYPTAAYLVVFLLMPPVERAEPTRVFESKRNAKR
jgi:hypothetical protein